MPFVSDDVPRRLPPGPDERLHTVVHRMEGGGAAGSTRIVRPTPARPAAKVLRPDGRWPYVQADEPAEHTLGTLWYDTDEVC